MGLVLLIMAAAGALVAAEIAALAAYRHFSVIWRVTTPVLIALAVVFGGLVLWDQQVARLDLATDSVEIQSVMAASMVVLLALLSWLMVRPPGRKATLGGSLTIALAGAVGMLGAIRLWHLMMA